LPHHIEPLDRECFICGTPYTVTWRSLSVLRCDNCAVKQDPPDMAEVEEIQRMIAQQWRIVETPPIEDIDCIREAQAIVQRICYGPNSNQLDEIRILFYSVVGVLNTMNIKHGGRGVAIRMMKDMLDDTSIHFPPEDRDGDTGGAPTIY